MICGKSRKFKGNRLKTFLELNILEGKVTNLPSLDHLLLQKGVSLM